MKSLEAIRHMSARSGVNISELSRRMGKQRNHWSVAFSKNVTPKVDTMAEAAEAMGYELVLEGHGERISLSRGSVPGAVEELHDCPETPSVAKVSRSDGTWFVTFDAGRAKGEMQVRNCPWCGEELL